MKFLLFQLYGVMQAWGSTGAGRIRKTEDHPTKSGVVTGLVASCLGIEDQEEDLQGLQDSVGFACREDIPGVPMVDFQTIRSNTRIQAHIDSVRRNKKLEMNTIMSDRHYLISALFTVCLWETGKIYSLENIAGALSNPVGTPYLGRKSCLLGLPFDPTIVEAPNLKEAFEKFVPDKVRVLLDDRFSREPRVFWEGPDNSFPIIADHLRRDHLLNRRARAYTSRQEHEGIIERALS